MYYQAWEFIFPRNDIFNDYALAIHFESFALRVIWPQAKQIAEFSTSCLSVFSLSHINLCLLKVVLSICPMCLSVCPQHRTSLCLYWSARNVSCGERLGQVMEIFNRTLQRIKSLTPADPTDNNCTNVGCHCFPTNIRKWKSIFRRLL